MARPVHYKPNATETTSKDRYCRGGPYALDSNRVRVTKDRSKITCKRCLEILQLDDYILSTMTNP